MSKPLIDGKKLNNMPSFTMPKMNNTEQNSKPESDNKPPTPRNNIQNNSNPILSKLLRLNF